MAIASWGGATSVLMSAYFLEQVKECKSWAKVKSFRKMTDQDGDE